MKTRFLILAIGTGLFSACGDEAVEQPSDGSVDVGAQSDVVTATSDTRPVVGNDGGPDVARPIDAPLPLSPDGGLGQDTPPSSVDGGGSDGSNDDTATNAGSVTGSTTAVFTAASGGELSLGGSRLFALAGAVATDRTISGTTVTGGNPPSPAEVAGPLYKLTSVATTLDGPMVLTLPVPTSVPAGRGVSVAFYDDDAKEWIAVPTKLSENTSEATALISRLGSYAIVAATASGSSVCPGTSKCGGLLEGTYRYTSSCESTGAITTGEACGSAGQADLTTSTALTGTISFSGSAFDSSVTASSQADVRANAGCTAYFKNEGGLSCPDVAGKVVGSTNHTWVCSGSIDTQCVCSGRVALPGQPQNSSGTFAADEGKVTMVVGGTSVVQQKEYCVSGNAVTFRDSQGAVQALVRAPAL